MDNRDFSNVNYSNALLVIGGNERFNLFLKKNGFQTESFSMSSYNGSPSPRHFKAVILLHDGSSQEEMPVLGQNELMNCITEGLTGVIVLEFVGYLVEKYKLANLKRFFPLVRTSGITPSYEDSKHTIIHPSHQLFSATDNASGTLPSWPSSFNCLYSGSVVKVKENAQALIDHKALGTALAVVKEPSRIAHFSGCPTYNGNRLFESWESSIAPFFIAAIHWVSSQKVQSKSTIDGTFKEIPLNVVPVEGIQLVQDLRKAFNNPDESDVTFVLEGDKQVHASRWLLSLRSEHFRALLKGQMRESQQKEVPLVDVNYQSFLGILEYMYTDALSFETIKADTIVDIMLLADRFLLHSLKVLCETYLIRNLNCENVINVLLAATRANASAIKQRAIAYVVTNKKALQEKPEFETLTNDPILLLEIVNEKEEVHVLILHSEDQEECESWLESIARGAADFKDKAIRRKEIISKSKQ